MRKNVINLPETYRWTNENGNGMPVNWLQFSALMITVYPAIWVQYENQVIDCLNWGKLRTKGGIFKLSSERKELFKMHTFMIPSF